MAGGGLIGALRVVLGMDSAAFEAGADAAEKRANAFSKRMNGIADGLTSWGQRFSLGVTAPLAVFGNQAIKAASDAAELQSAFDATFSGMTVSMNKWAQETGDAMGRSTQEMQQAATTFGMFFNQAAPTKKAAAEMSQSFSVLAQDLASFYNTDPGTAMEKLRSGLSGESEPLRDFGVFLTEAAVSAKGLELGLGGVSGKLSEQEKIMARAALIMESTAIAQGDVARTSGSTANQLRASQAAWQELSITIGTKLLPVITPLITKVGELLNGFSKLSPQVQSLAVGTAAAAAALGPLMIVIGGVARAVGAASMVLAPLVPLIGLHWAGALKNVIPMLGLLGRSLMALALTPAGAVIAAIAGAGILIYQNWNRIAPIFAEIGTAISGALGPGLAKLWAAMQDLGASIGEAFGQIMQSLAPLGQALGELLAGPLGSLLNGAIGVLADLSRAWVETMGPPLLALINGVITQLTGFFEAANSIFKGIAALLKGDFAGAASFALQAAQQLFGGMIRGFDQMTGGALSSIARLVTGVKDWIVGRLGGVFTWLQDKLKAAGNQFFELYDAVVGHSYVPDMVDGIVAHMARLDKGMVQPIRDATAEAKELFADLQRSAAGILDNLFPEARAQLNFQRDRDTLNRYAADKRSGMTPEQLAAAQARLSRQYLDSLFGPVNSGLKDPGALAAPNLDKVQADMAKMVIAANDNFGGPMLEMFERVSRGIADSIADMESSVRGFVQSIKKGDILGTIIGLFDVIASITGAIGGIKSGFSSTGIQFRANGGPINAGKPYIVGERGPELVIPSTSGTVISNRDLRGGAGGGTRVINVHMSGVMTSDDFWQRIAALDARAAQMGTQGALSAFGHQQRQAAA